MKEKKHIFIFELDNIKYLGVRKIFSTKDKIEVNIIATDLPSAVDDVQDFISKQYLKADGFRLRKIIIDEK